MEAALIGKARLRLHQASASLARLETLAAGINVPAFEYEWFITITLINSAYAIFEKAASLSPQSKQWFCSVDKHTIRKDPLLRYVLHARNMEYHNFGGATAAEVGGAKYLGYDEGSALSVADIETGEVLQTFSGGIMLEGDVSSFSFKFRLADVIDHGDIYEPPTSHLGAPLSDNAPVAVARRAIEYHNALIDEGLVKFG